MLKKPFTKLHIGDTYWDVFILTPKKFEECFGEDLEAVTAKKERQIYFNSTILGKDTVIHELFHAYFDQALATSCDLSCTDTEEIAAEVMAKYLDEYVKNCKSLYNKLRRIK